MSDYKDLSARCATLLDKMSNDPERPWWQLELVRISLEALTVAAVLNQQHNKTSRSYAELLTKVESLEQRYSELLYKISSIRDT